MKHFNLKLWNFHLSETVTEPLPGITVKHQTRYNFWFTSHKIVNISGYLNPAIIVIGLTIMNKIKYDKYSTGYVALKRNAYTLGEKWETLSVASTEPMFFKNI